MSNGSRDEGTAQARPSPLPAPTSSPAADRRAKQQARFLEVLAQGWSVTRAAAVVGIDRRQAYKWREADDSFREAWDHAYEAGTDALEDVALQRATIGHERPLMYQGKQVGTELVVSDKLAELMLRARRPAKYRDRAALEVSTAGRPSAERLSANRSGTADGATAEAFATVARAAREREQGTPSDGR